MHLKKQAKFLLVTSAVLLMSACNVLPESNEETSQQAQNQVLDTLEQSSHSSYYRPLIDEDGNYPTSENRGTTLQLNSRVNIKLFEDDLIRLAQDYFPVENHFFQEGQFITAETARAWLRRESSDNPDGLNPADEDQPAVLTSILEHDFYQEQDGEYVLSGISIGLAMDPTTEDTESGSRGRLETDQVREIGQEMGSVVIERLRAADHIPDNVSIMVGVFEQAPSDNLAGGTYLTTGFSDSAESSPNYNVVNERRAVFPVQGGDTTEGNNFRNFQSQVENFTPNLNGVVGRAHYVDDILTDLTINITTQFYGQGEIVAFTHYINQMAMTYLPENIRIEIIVESLNGTESILVREVNEDEFYTHIFN